MYSFYSLQIQVGKGLPTAEEAFNFFTLNFDPDPPDVIETSSRRRQKQRKTTDEDEEHEDVDEDIQEENETQVTGQPIFFFFCQNYFLPFFICIRWTNCLIFILLSEWRSSSCTNPRRFICHWPVTPGLLGNKESRVCRVPKTSSATKRTPVYTQLSNRYIISCLKYFNSHLHLPHMGKNFIMLHFHSSNLHQTAWKHETSIPGGWGSLCRGKASRIPDQWEYSGESDFENGGGNIS